MSDTVRRVDYFSIQCSNKPGEGARYLKELREAGVNLLAFTGFPSGRRAQIDFIPENTAALKAAAKKMGLDLGEKKSCFLIQGEDRVGVISEFVEKVAAAGINITALNGVSAGMGRYGAFFWVKPGDVAKVAKLLNATK